MPDENLAATSTDEGSEEQEIDFDQDLSKAYDRIQEGKPATEEEHAGEETPQGDESEPAGETKEPEGKAADGVVEDKAEGEAEPATEPAGPPDSWTAEAKEKFPTIDPVVQQEILKREQDFTNGHAKSEEARQLAKEFKETVSPYEAMIRSEGGTPITAVKDLMNMAYTMRRGTQEQKAQLLLNTARQFNVDLGLAIPKTQQHQEGDEFTDPALAALEARQNKLEQKAIDQEQFAAQARMEEAQKVISDFVEAKGEDGQPKYPHYEAVKVTMGAFIESGQAKTLEEAYEKATWADDKVRADRLENERKALEKKQLDETKKRAAEAKKTAGTQVKTEAMGDQVPAAKSWDDELSEKYDEITA